MADMDMQNGKEGKDDLQKAIEIIATKYGVDPERVLTVIQNEFEPKEENQGQEGAGGGGPLIGGGLP